MHPIIIPLAAFVGVASLVGAIAYLLRDFGASTTEDRLEVLTGRKSPVDESKSIMKEEMMREALSPVAGLLGRLGRRFENVGLFFEQADSPIKPDTFFGLALGNAFVGVLLAWAVSSPPPLFPVAALVFGSLPFVWLFMRRRRRFKKFATQLPDALELIGRALRSGHSLASSLHLVESEMPEPIATEFGNAYEQQNLGVSVEQALKNVLKRVPNMDLKFFVTAVAIQRQSGGDLAEIIDKISYIIRERFKIMGQVQALTGEGRISGIVLMALPIVLFIAIYQLNPDYIMVLFTDPLGHKLIGFAAVTQLLGAIAIKKIVAIKI